MRDGARMSVWESVRCGCSFALKRLGLCVCGPHLETHLREIRALYFEFVLHTRFVAIHKPNAV